MSDEAEDLCNTIFNGLDKPLQLKDQIELAVSGIVFLQQLAVVDRLFGLTYQDYREGIESNRAAEQYIKNWQILNVTLFDHGLEIKEEYVFATLAGSLKEAAVLSSEIQQLNSRDALQLEALQRVGPEVPVRQRVHPFLGTAVNSVVLANQNASSGGINALKPPAHTAQPTRVYMQDSTRFAKKRMMLSEQLDRQREKEIKAQRAKERKEREAQRIAQEAAKNKDQSSNPTAQDNSREPTVQIQRNDPTRIAEKKRRTDLLRELETLETAYTQDERRLVKLKKNQLPIPVDSPRRVVPHNSERRPSPMRIKNESSIPFSTSPGAQKKKTKR